MPNRISFAKAVAKARIAGNQAAKHDYDEMKRKGEWEECGGARMSLAIEDAKWRRFFDSLIAKPLRGFEVRRGKEGTYFISIRDMAGYQEATICGTAAQAALKILEAETGGKGTATLYFT